MAKAEKSRKAWSPADEAEVALLAKAGLSGREIGSVLKRSEAAVRAKAAELKVPIDSKANDALRRLLAGSDDALPGIILREDLGGVIGVRWCLPSRSGDTFCAAYCQALLDQQMIVPAANAGRDMFMLRAAE